MLSLIIIFFPYHKCAVGPGNGSYLLCRQREIADNVSDVLSGVQFDSETLSDNSHLFELISKTYKAGDQQRKRSDLLTIQNSIFDSFNRRQSITKIGALYHCHTGELFNFYSGYKDDEETIDLLLSMGVADQAKLSRYVWYPLQSNFLSDVLTGNPREDYIICGSRRIYRHESLSYPYVQIFSIKEITLFNRYENIQKQTGGEVFILSANGSLLSSSKIENVEVQQTPPELIRVVLQREENTFMLQMDGINHFVNVSEIENRITKNEEGNWLSVLMVPEQIGLRNIYWLFALTFSLLFIFLLCGVTIFYNFLYVS